MYVVSSASSSPSTGWSPRRSRISAEASVTPPLPNIMVVSKNKRLYRKLLDTFLVVKNLPTYVHVMDSGNRKMTSFIAKQEAKLSQAKCHFFAKMWQIHHRRNAIFFLPNMRQFYHRLNTISICQTRGLVADPSQEKRHIFLPNMWPHDHHWQTAIRCWQIYDRFYEAKCR